MLHSLKSKLVLTLVGSSGEVSLIILEAEEQLRGQHWVWLRVKEIKIASQSRARCGVKDARILMRVSGDL